MCKNTIWVFVTTACPDICVRAPSEYYSKNVYSHKGCFGRSSRVTLKLCFVGMYCPEVCLWGPSVGYYKNIYSRQPAGVFRNICIRRRMQLPHWCSISVVFFKTYGNMLPFVFCRLLSLICWPLIDIKGK